MKLIVKKLQGGECAVEVVPSTPVSDIKREVAEKLKIPVEQQKLLFLGRTLVDEQTVASYPTIKEGSKLNLVVKKPEGLYELTFKAFKKSGMSDVEAKNMANKFMKVLQDRFNKLSWDDIERLATSCLQDDKQKQNKVESEAVAV